MDIVQKLRQINVTHGDAVIAADLIDALRFKLTEFHERMMRELHHECSGECSVIKVLEDVEVH